jgi:hypothetical protein
VGEKRGALNEMILAMKKNLRLNSARKNPPFTPFDKLRVNGVSVEIGEDCPFVLSPSTISGQALSKHEQNFLTTF